MEKRFQIVTDSSCDLPQALADELDLAVLPLHVLIGEHTYANYLDGREIGFREFYDKLRDGERATTSAVNVSEFTAVMEEKLKAGLDILFIGFSSGLSTTYQSGASPAASCGKNTRSGSSSPSTRSARLWARACFCIWPRRSSSPARPWTRSQTTSARRSHIFATGSQSTT